MLDGQNASKNCQTQLVPRYPYIDERYINIYALTEGLNHTALMWRFYRRIIIISRCIEFIYIPVHKKEKKPIRRPLNWVKTIHARFNAARREIPSITKARGKSLLCNASSSAWHVKRNRRPHPRQSLITDTWWERENRFKSFIALILAPKLSGIILPRDRRKMMKIENSHAIPAPKSRNCELSETTRFDRIGKTLRRRSKRANNRRKKFTNARSIFG